jgi:hypothetical protein
LKKKKKRKQKEFFKKETKQQERAKWSTTPRSLLSLSLSLSLLLNVFKKLEQLGLSSLKYVHVCHAPYPF